MSACPKAWTNKTQRPRRGRAGCSALRKKQLDVLDVLGAMRSHLQGQLTAKDPSYCKLMLLQVWSTRDAELIAILTNRLVVVDLRARRRKVVDL